MSYSKIDIMQIEKNDIPTLKHAINLQPGVQQTTDKLNRDYSKSIIDGDSYAFSVRALKEGGFGLSLIGFCFVDYVDWVSRNAELRFFTVGAVSPEHEKIIASKLVDFCFDELNLNKVYVNLTYLDRLTSTLSDIGFVAEGLRREAAWGKGRFQDVTVYALLAQEYRAKK